MSLTHALLLGLLQGATEFLPISSSGHLVLVPWLLGWPEPGLAFDALVHWGTAVAVVGYFWRDWVGLLRGVGRAVRTRSRADPDARLAGLILLGTLPAALAGWLLEDFFEGMFARPVAAAGFLLVTAGVLTLAEGSGRASVPARLSWADALLIGLAQAVAILPGISRSGATIAAGMGRGLVRASAARFSFLLSTPIILGAGLLQVLDLVSAGDLAAQAPILVVGFLTALLSGLACIHFLLRYLQRRPLYPFALYCALFGIASLLVAFL
ncbi:MAG TPA: undecaprenyl-diphosphatase UppP [Anaerolineales bacterium]|nr:undecaprenyl-diphosphatase UppP [Anaerolineae bacterium]HIQ01584.1 undecaprenyl-diphosphatase UppP [Anaerolineales bacterium]